MPTAQHARRRVEAAWETSEFASWSLIIDWRGDEPESPDRRMLQAVIEPLCGAEIAALLTPLEIEAAAREAIRAGLGRSTARDMLGLLRRSYRLAAARGWTTQDPAGELTLRDLV